MFAVALPLIAAALCFAFAWYYWNFIVPYQGIPRVSFTFLVLRNFLFRKIPTDVPVAHYYFQLLVETLKQFHSEGMALVTTPKPNIFVFGEEAVKILINDPSALNKMPEYQLTEEFFGDGLITCNKEKWQKKRKMLDPIFSMRMMKNQVKYLNRNASVLVNDLMREEDRSGMILKLLKFYSFSNMTEFILDLKADDPKRRADIERLIEFAKKFPSLVMYRWLHPWTHMKWATRFFSKGRQYLQAVQEGTQIMSQILQDMTETLPQDSSAESKDTEAEICSSKLKSFVNIVKDHYLKDTSMTHWNVLMEISTFVFAGSDTVYQTAMWCIFTLGHHPEMQETLYQEVEASEEQDDISYDELKNMKYLECVILETLRLYPVVPVYGRKLGKNVQCGKHNIPEGTNVLFFPFLYHRNPEIYPDPEKFYPERFLEGNSQKRPWTHIAFSGGIRNCIGKRFAMLEIKIILAHIIRNFKWTSLDRREDVQLNWEVILAPVKPLRIHFVPR